MKNIIVAWCNTNEKDFENFVPLQFVGKRNLKLGYSNDFEILFLDGFDRLSESYKKSLKDLGFALHDVSGVYFEFDKKYPQLNRFSDYEKKCFLRWLVIDKFFNKENIIHYDGDIVFNEDPAIIAQKVKGLTFILQGCPAFTVISNTEWFDQYKQQLDFFVKDIESYSQLAWKERSGWEVTFRTKLAGSRFRKIISSDQDLFSHLIHTDKIIQDSVEKIFLNLYDYILFENPLVVHLYNDGFPFNYFREKGIDYFSYIRRDAQDCFYKKRVLFWHMQSCFNFYASKLILRKTLFKFLPLGKIKMRLSSNNFNEDYINKKLTKLFNHNDRLNVYKYFFEKNDFSGLMNNRKWWKDGIFQ